MQAEIKTQPQQEETDPALASLETTLISDIIQNLDSLEEKTKGKKGEETIELRTKQLCLAKILVNVYCKNIFYLIKAHTMLGISYIDIEYFEQAQEHLLCAFKLIENLTHENNVALKEFQVKILINLSKCYLENGKAAAALSISEKCLKINEALVGEDHISNADMLYVLARINTELRNYNASLENLKKMFQIYEAVFSFESEKTAKICTEIGQIYELADNIQEAIDSYKNSFSIWENIIKDANYEVLFTLAIKISELFAKTENTSEAYEFLKKTEIKYGSFLLDKKKKRINYKKLLTKYSSNNEDLPCYLQELLDLEVNGECTKSLAKTCISIASTNLQLGKTNESIEYFDKAEKMFVLFGNANLAKDIKQKKEELQSSCY